MRILSVKSIHTSFFLFCISLFSACAEQKNQKNNMTDDLLTDQSVALDTATFGTGCFWCTEAIFQRLYGVVKVVSGYSGGHVANPTYEEVCDGKTGYAEVCQVAFDPEKISYNELLKVFWTVHDPTTLNRQGNDVGEQYRSVVFYHDDDQKIKAEKYKAVLTEENVYNKPIVTAIEPFKNFYSAESYHQNYYNNNHGQAYCRFVIQPKLEKFEHAFQTLLRKDNGLANSKN